ncbi:alkene reductase [Streptomyces sp. NPDC001068]|uniref:alkene reductase n=1 Tax=Streptomyces sp. NPDC001068 TaxID=3364544 RepID=UPI003688F0FB
MPKAFEPYVLGGKSLAHRIVMAPMTRSRAHGPGQSPTGLMATYYAQRAHGGLIITEGTQPSAAGQGNPDTPGIHSAEQVAGWRKVTEAVHAEGGVIFVQLMHAGRIGHPSVTGKQPVGPSAVAAKGQVYTQEGRKDFVTPLELTEEAIGGTIADFVTAARNAVYAGFDGVELQGANGYLIHQFLAPNSNRRTDRWGGSPQARTRFAVEVAGAVAEAIGPDRVGLRISPASPLNDIAEDDRADVERTYTALVDSLTPFGLAYLHHSEAPGIRDLTTRLRKQWPGTYILNPYTGAEPTGPDQLELADDGTTDLISFGALYLANPDLPARLKAGGPFNTHDRATTYGGDHRGYTDYPALG